MTIQAQSADGTIHEFPDGTNPSVIDGVMKNYAQAQPGARTLPQSLARQGGLTARYLVEGGLSPFTFLANGIGAAYNKGADLVEGQGKGYRFPDQAQAVSNELTKIGLPQPETPFERVVGDASRGVSSAGSGIATGSLLAKAANPVTQGVGAFLKSAAPQQVVSGATSGAASGAAREAGLPWWAQIGAGLAAGALPFMVGGSDVPDLPRKSVSPVTAKAGDVASQVAGTATGTGGTPIAEAFKAGREGGQAAEAFQANLRGDVSPEDVLDQAKSALGSMKADRNTAYRSGMADLSKDQTVLSFDPIDNALNKTASVANFKGIDLKPKTADARQAVQSLIDNWKSLPAAEYHTPEGFDALKQQIGDLRDSFPYGDQSRIVVDNAYNAVKNAIKEQAPGYAKTMGDYQEASDLIDNIQRTLSLNPRATVDTQMRKLQSVMRDGVNTNYGSRADLARALNDVSGGTLVPALAGQSLNSWTPRGLMRAVAGGELLGAGGLALHDPLAAIGTAAMLPLTSPRLAGEAAYYAGKAAPVISAAARRSLETGSLPFILQNARPQPAGLLGSMYSQ